MSDTPDSEFSPNRAKKPLPMPKPNTGNPPSEWREWLDSLYDRS